MAEMMQDQAIKFGAGRYRQGRGLLKQCGEEIRYFGQHVYIIAGPRAFHAVRKSLLFGLRQAGVWYTIKIYEGPCSYEAAAELAEKSLSAGCDEIVGVGGGKIMDLAKAVGEKAGLGVINIPTSIATCAAFTNMSIMYTRDSAYLESWHYEHEVDGVFVDLDVIADCPVHYAAAGIADAMAKKIEIPNGKAQVSPFEMEFDAYSAYRMAQYTYEMFLKMGPKALHDIKNHQVSPEVEYIAFLSIALTGVLSNITRGRGQSALAHRFYYGIRTLFQEEAENLLHGEIVGTGLFMQLSYNTEQETAQTKLEKEELAQFMRKVGLACSVKELGIEASEKRREQMIQYLWNSPYVEKSEAGEKRLQKAVDVIFC